MNSSPARSAIWHIATMSSQSRAPALGRQAHGQAAVAIGAEHAELEAVRPAHRIGSARVSHGGLVSLQRCGSQPGPLRGRPSSPIRRRPNTWRSVQCRRNFLAYGSGQCRIAAPNVARTGAGYRTHECSKSRCGGGPPPAYRPACASAPAIDPARLCRPHGLAQQPCAPRHCRLQVTGSCGANPAALPCRHPQSCGPARACCLGKPPC